MPAKRKRQVKPTPVNGSFFCNSAPLQLPTETRATLENRIINHIRILDSVTLALGRKLIEAALKANKLTMQIGLEPHCRSDSADIKETADHPLSPNYRYSGHDVRKLEPMLMNDHAMLDCTATLSYGDGGVSVETDDVERALDIISENYREPELVLYFNLMLL